MAVALAFAATATVAHADPCSEETQVVVAIMRADPTRQTDAGLFDRLATACAGDGSSAIEWYSLGISFLDYKLPEAADQALDRYDAFQIANGRTRDYEIRSRIAIFRSEWAAAEALLVQALQFYADRPEIRSAHAATLLQRRAQVLLQMNDYAAARGFAEASLAMLEDASGPRHASLWEPVTLIGDIHAAEGDSDRALARYEQALAYFRPEHRTRTGPVRERMARSYLAAGRLEEAETQARLATDLVDEGYAGEEQARVYQRTLAAVVAARGRGDEAIAILAEAAGSTTAAFAIDGSATNLLATADVLWQAKQYRYAALYYEFAYQALEHDQPFGSPARVTVLINAGHAHLLAGSIHFAVDHYRGAATEMVVLGRPPARQKSFRHGQVAALWVAAHWTAD